MSRVLRYLLPLVTLVLLCASDLSAQSSGSKNKFPVPFGPNNAGREFYFTLPANWDVPTASQYYIRLYITSGVRTQVKVWVGPGIKKTFYTLPYDVVTVDLNPIEAQAFTRNDLAPVPDDQIYRNKAVHIEAGAPIVVYAMNRTSFTSDGILALPVNALGREYVVASYAAVIGNTQELPSQFVVVAPYDGTTVNIEQPMQTPNHAEGEQVTVELNKGDVYSAMTVGYGGDMSGAVIRASKPVAVLAGQNCTYIPNQIIYCCCDHLSEMMLPVSSWGKFYQGVSYQGRLKGDFWRVFAGAENTTIYINGSKYATLNRMGGEEGSGWLEYHATGPGLTEFTADKPIYIAQYNTSSAYDGVQSDPFYLVLTPVEQYQTQLTFTTPANDFPQNFINLVADSATYRQIEIAPGGTDNWQAVWKMPGIGLVRYYPTKINGRTYLGVTITIPPGTYRMRGPVPFAGYIYGFSAYDSYGYPLSVATGDLSRPDTVAPEIRKTVECNGKATVNTIDGPVDPDIRTNLSTVELDPDGTFNYDLNVKRFESGVSVATDYTLTVINPNAPGQAVVVISDMAGNLTLDTVKYNPFRATITPNPLDFGSLITGESKRMKVTISNPSGQPIHIQEAKLKLGTEGFTLLSPTGSFVLGPVGSGTESIEAEIEFVATKSGLFQDSVGLRDTCGLRYLVLVEASVGKPVIKVTDNDFGTLLVGTQTGIWYMDVSNNTTEGGVLRVTGASGPTDNAAFILPNGLPAFPFDLKPGERRQIAVIFSAVAEQTYLDQIVFTHNAPANPDNDSVGVLQGKGVKSGVLASSFTWPRVRVGRRGIDTFVTVTNFGAVPVRILNMTDQGDVGDFTVLNRGQIEGALLAPGEVDTVLVRFTPTRVGDRQMVITYSPEPQQTEPVTSTLRGIGVEPLLATQNYDYGTMDLSDPEVNQKVHFWIPLGSAYRDTVTITGFRFRSDAGTGGTADFRSLPLDTALQLIPGVRDSVEFTGFFLAQGVGLRTAELEALTLDNVNVTSNWTGQGTTRSAGIGGAGGSVTGVCVGDTAFLTATIENTGQVDLFVDSLRVNSPDFEIVDPSPDIRFRIRSGDPAVTVILRYMPKVKELQGAQLRVFNSTGTALDLPIAGESMEDTIRSVVRLSGSKGNKTEFGDNMIGTISLAELPAGRTITNYSVVINYDTAQLIARTDPASLVLGSGNPSGGTVRVSPSSRRGRLVLDVTLPVGLTNAGDLISVPFGVRFTTVMTRSLSATVIAAAPCLTILDSNATIDVEPLCGLNLRMIVSSASNYALDQNKPNPFNPTTVIRYSLGLDGPTQVILFDASGKILQTLVDEHQLPGTYELTLDVANLPSGNYYYKLISGDWSETKMLTVVK